MGYEILEAVLGLSMTPTSLGWVLVDGDDADGPTLARDELRVERRGDGLDVGGTARRATTAALRLRTMVETQGQRLRGIGVTWSDDAAPDAALLLESLTEAGFDNVMPVRFPQAAESLAHGVDPVSDSERAAVCVAEAGLATLVLMDADDDTAPSVSQHEVGDDDGLVDWLAALFAPGRWRPGVLTLAGTGAALDALAVRLERELALPVYVRTGAQLGLARGAAQALAPYADLAVDSPSGQWPSDDDDAVQPRGWSLPYAGALAMLVAGVLTFVVSASAAVSLELTPVNDLRPTERVADAPAAPSVSHAVKPAAVASSASEPPAAAPGEPDAIGSVVLDPPPVEEPDRPDEQPAR